jgi:glycosyltransferase involved in cell wall biosynthesis
MKISVIVPCLNEERFLPNLISDLLNQSLLPYEILIIDAGSKDKTLELIKEDDIVKVIHTKPNIGAQRKTGGLKAAGDMLFFFDSDVRLDKDFIKNAIIEIQNKNLDLATYRYIPYNLSDDNKVEDSSKSIRFLYKFFNTLFLIFKRISPSGAGSGIFTTKENFLKLNGFSENLKFDDIDFIRRGAKVGKFDILNIDLLVSDRRFVRYGVFKTFLSYLVLSTFFLFNAFKYAEIVEYKFSDYKK